jgi:hypothetical protein
MRRRPNIPAAGKAGIALWFAFVRHWLGLPDHHDPRQDFGDDVAGNIRASEYYLAHDFKPDLIWNVSWVWGGGLFCTTIACAAAWRLRARRVRQVQFSAV